MIPASLPRLSTTHQPYSAESFVHFFLSWTKTDTFNTLREGHAIFSRRLDVLIANERSLTKEESAWLWNRMISMRQDGWVTDGSASREDRGVFGSSEVSGGLRAWATRGRRGRRANLAEYLPSVPVTGTYQNTRTKQMGVRVLVLYSPVSPASWSLFQPVLVIS